MLDTLPYRLAEHARNGIDAASPHAYPDSNRSSLHQRPPWAVIRSPPSRASLPRTAVPHAQSTDRLAYGYGTASRGANQAQNRSTRTSCIVGATTSPREAETRAQAFVHDMTCHSKADAHFWRPEAGPWSMFAEKASNSSLSTSASLKVDTIPYWDPDFEAASVATEMALRVLQSDDFSDASSSTPLEEASDDSVTVGLTPPSSAGVYDIWGCNTPALPFPRAAGLFASFEELRIFGTSTSTPSQGDDTQSQDKESESDFPKKRGKARMSQEKRRRLARRKEREALAATQQGFHHLADPSRSWSPSPSMNADAPRTRLSASLPRAANWQTVPAPRSPAVTRGSSGGDSSSSSSYEDRADSDNGRTDRLRRAGADGVCNAMQRTGSASSTSTGAPYTPITETRSGARPYSPWSAPVPYGAPEHSAPLATAREALDKVETLRALEQLTTQMLANKQSNAAPLMPTLQETTRNTWRPAYSFAAGHAPSTTEVTLPGKFAQQQTGPEAASSRDPRRSLYLSSPAYGRPSPPTAPAAQVPIPVPMSYEQAARTSHFDGRQEYGRSIGHQPFAQQRPRGPPVGVPAQLSTSGPNNGRLQLADRQRHSKTFVQRQQYGAPTPFQTSPDNQYGRWQAQQW